MLKKKSTRIFDVIESFAGSTFRILGTLPLDGPSNPEGTTSKTFSYTERLKEREWLQKWTDECKLNNLI